MATGHVYMCNLWSSLHGVLPSWVLTLPQLIQICNCRVRSMHVFFFFWQRAFSVCLGSEKCNWWSFSLCGYFVYGRFHCVDRCLLLSLLLIVYLMYLTFLILFSKTKITIRQGPSLEGQRIFGGPMGTFIQNIQERWAWARTNVTLFSAYIQFTPSVSLKKKTYSLCKKKRQFSF